MSLLLPLPLRPSVCLCVCLSVHLSVCLSVRPSVSLSCSRRLWQHVTASLKTGNMEDATEHKHRLEEHQRSEGKQRAAAKTPWKPKYFVKEVSEPTGQHQETTACNYTVKGKEK